jgi:hypothetical protein
MDSELHGLDLKKKLFQLLSTGHSPESSAFSLKQLLCCLLMVAVPTGLSYENVFRVLIMQFLDLSIGFLLGYLRLHSTIFELLD